MNEYEGFNGSEEEPEGSFEYEIEENEGNPGDMSVAVASHGEIVILSIQMGGVGNILFTLPPLVAEELAEELQIAAEEAKAGFTVEAILKAGEDEGED